MPSLPVLSGRETVKAFAHVGWQMARQRGSHIILVKSGSMVTLSVPDHRALLFPPLLPSGRNLPNEVSRNSREPRPYFSQRVEVAKGTLRSLIRSSGLTVDEFAALARK